VTAIAIQSCTECN